MQTEKPIQDISTIIRLNLTKKVAQVFAQNGMLLKRFSFEAEANQYGELVAASNNGKILVFSPSLTLVDTLAHKVENTELAIERLLTFSILKLTPFGLKLVKHINVRQGMKQYFRLKSIFNPQNYQNF